MTLALLYLAAVVLWIAGTIAWGVYFAWDTKDIVANAFVGGLFLPFALFILAVIGAVTAAHSGVDWLNTTVQRRRRRRAEIEREIAEWLR
jgi:hypothetical protein